MHRACTGAGPTKPRAEETKRQRTAPAQARTHRQLISDGWPRSFTEPSRIDAPAAHRIRVLLNDEDRRKEARWAWNRRTRAG